jgi:hypothetical protein
MNQSQLFFPTSKTKLIVLSICSFGAYNIYWFYKNWKFLKVTQGLNIRPIWRAGLPIFYCYSLFKRVRECANENNEYVKYSPGWLAVGYVLLSISWQTTGSQSHSFLWLITMLAVLTLLPVQNVINSLNAKVASNIDINERFSGWNITTIVFGIIMWGLVIFDMSLPYSFNAPNELASKIDEVYQDRQYSEAINAAKEELKGVEPDLREKTSLAGKNALLMRIAIIESLKLTKSDRSKLVTKVEKNAD